MTITGIVITALILLTVLSFVKQAARPYPGPTEQPEEPETTGVAVMLCHRLTGEHDHPRMVTKWLPARAKLVDAHWDTVGALRYVQVPQLSRWNIVFLLVALSRSWLVAAIGSMLHGLPSPAGRKHPDELWDLIEVFEFADSTGAAAFLASEAAEALAEDGDGWSVHAQAIPMVTTRAYLRTHFAPDAAVTLFCLRGRPEIGRDGMIDYWLDQHRPFVQGLQPVLNYAWYDQHIARGAEDLDAAARDYLPGHAPWDGMASIGYPHLRDLVYGAVDPRVQLANLRLVYDETRFIDLPQSALMLGTVTHIRADDPVD
ncbi:MAG: EthD domain-containing protein [Pseudomonadota bacterium]